MKRIVQNFDLVVAGGGVAGFCAAVAAARRGLKTCLVHERPVLGGVASSEMRVTVHGAACHHAYAREGGIIGEALADERARNHEWINENGWTNSVLDITLYDIATREPNLTLHLNTPVVDVLMAGGAPVNVSPVTTAGYYERPACASSRRIAGLLARTLSAETELELQAPLFVDATGDGIVADRAGCGWRMGSEGQAETGELHAPKQASTDTMGNSIHIRARDIGRAAPFTAPAWAVQHTDGRFFYEQGRRPTDPRGGFWWIEIGVPWHTIHDNEKIRHELTRHALGVWDWMKNRDPKMKDVCRNFALDFIGQVPGKRESRRVYGRHWVTENELQADTVFPDEVGFGGWFIDLHTPGGLLAANSEPASAEGYRPDSEYAAKSYVGPYGFPLRSLIARDVDNLFMAGRCLSSTRAALGSLRVMATTSLMGQAVGTAAAIAGRDGLPAVAADAAAGGPVIRSIQQALLRDGCFLPHVVNQDPADLARYARVSASSCARLFGQSPGDPKHDNGQLTWSGGVRGYALDQVQGQVLFLAGEVLDCIDLLLDNGGSVATRLPLRLVRLDRIWDYRRGGAAVVAETTLTVAPGEDRWVTWDLHRTDLPAGTYRIEAGPAPGLIWRQAAHIQPGCFAQQHLSPTRMRDRHVGLAFRLSPGQPVYEAVNVQTGVTRPQSGTNLWRSDAGQGMPQWLELAWETPQVLAQVELTFAGHLLNEVHSEPPFFKDAQTVCDYAIELDGCEVLCVTGNHQRHRIHELPNGSRGSCLRLVVLATNGDPSAAVYEIRCY